MDISPSLSPRSRPIAPRFRLRYGKMLREVGLITFLALEVLLWTQLQVIAAPWLHRVLMLAYFSYKLGLIALLFWFLAVVSVLVIFRLVVRPLMERWYNPRHRDQSAIHDLPFIQKVDEQIVAECGARRVIDRRRPPGSLILTTHALYFCPFFQEGDFWMRPRNDLAELTTRNPRRRVLNLIEGYPYNVVVRDEAGAETTFVVADPGAVLSWFDEPLPESHPESTEDESPSSDQRVRSLGSGVLSASSNRTFV